MKNLAVAVIVGGIVALGGTQVKSDIVCPEGSLEDFNSFTIMEKFFAKNEDYHRAKFDGFAVKLRELIITYDAEDFLPPATPEELQEKIDGVWDVGRFADEHEMTVKMMFAYGAGAAISVVEAYCVSAPNRKPWNEDIKEDRQKKWCALNPDTHLCPD